MIHNYLSLVMKKTFFFAYAKTKTQISCAVNAKLISAFAFTTRIVQSLFCLILNFKPLAIFSDCTAWSVSDQVRNPEDQFSHNEAHFNLVIRKPGASCSILTTTLVNISLIFIRKYYKYAVIFCLKNVRIFAK